MVFSEASELGPLLFVYISPRAEPFSDLHIKSHDERHEV